MVEAHYKGVEKNKFESYEHCRDAPKSSAGYSYLLEMVGVKKPEANLPICPKVDIIELLNL